MILFGLEIYESILVIESTYHASFPDSQYATVESVLSEYPFNKKRVITNDLKSVLVYFKCKQGHLQGFINFLKESEFFSLGFLLWLFCYFKCRLKCGLGRTIFNIYWER